MQLRRVWGTRNRLQILERGPQLGCGLPAGSWAAGRGWEAGCPRPGRRLRRGRSGLSSHLVPVPVSAPREARPGPAPRTCRAPAPIASRRPATKAAPVQLQPGPRPAPRPPARDDPAPAPAPPARSPPPRALTAGPTARAQGRRELGPGCHCAIPAVSPGPSARPLGRERGDTWWEREGPARAEGVGRRGAERADVSGQAPGDAPAPTLLPWLPAPRAPLPPARPAALGLLCAARDLRWRRQEQPGARAPVLLGAHQWFAPGHSLLLQGMRCAEQTS